MSSVTGFVGGGKSEERAQRLTMTRASGQCLAQVDQVSGKSAIKWHQHATTIILLNLSEETTTNHDQDCCCGKDNTNQQFNKNIQ